LDVAPAGGHSDRPEAHVLPIDGFGDGLGIEIVVLVRLYELRWGIRRASWPCYDNARHAFRQQCKSNRDVGYRNGES
jgi:hypothetical protein